MSNPVSAIGITDAQWAAASDSQKRAWLGQASDSLSKQPLSKFGSTNQQSGVSQVASAAASGAFGGLAGGFVNTIGNKGFWIRFGTVAAGAALAWGGIALILASNKEVRGAAVTAAKTAAVA